MKIQEAVVYFPDGDMMSYITKGDQVNVGKFCDDIYILDGNRLIVEYNNSQVLEFYGLPYLLKYEKNISKNKETAKQ